MFPCGKRANFSSSEELWASRHTPSCSSDLGVHKKKVEEVVTWVEKNSSCNSRKASVLLLVGGTGVGKTVTLQVVAKQLNVEVVEWINPMTDIPEDSSRSYSYEEPVYRDGFRESQMSKFTEFLFRTNRYPSLSIFGGEASRSRILLVKDFPNAVLQDPRKFHDILKSYRQRGSGPLVFIMNDSYGSSSNSERVLFPPDVQFSLHIDVIRFNPVAPTSMTKVLLKIATSESRQSVSTIRMPTAEIIDQFVITSGGDMRSAINSLQFYCLNSSKISLAKTKSTSLVSNSSRKRSYSNAAKSISKSTTSSSDDVSIGVRDTNLTLFRALGKILYCKREKQDQGDSAVVLPNHLSSHRRDALAMIPEEVVEKSQMSPESFTAFLHQNFLDFYAGLDDIASACEYLSDSDYLTREWTSRSVLEQHSSSVAVRGILFCNTSRATVGSTGCNSGLRWKPLHKPQWFSAIKKFRENRELIRSLFAGYQLPVNELVTEMLPYIAILNAPNLSQSQKTIVKDVTKFKFSVHSLPDKLDEKEFATSDENFEDFQTMEQNSKDQNGLSKINKNTENNIDDDYKSECLVSKTSDSDDEFNIEEFDD